MRGFRHCLLFLLLLGLTSSAFAAELVVWINSDKGYKGLRQVGQRFTKTMGVKVKVETPDDATTKFANAARMGKGPDIFIWAHDNTGEWADSGILRPIDVDEAFKARFHPKAWQAVTHKGRIWGYPIAFETTTLIYNKAMIRTPPRTLAGIRALAGTPEFKADGKYPLLFDYGNPYYTWGIIASTGARIFGRDDNGDYDPRQVEVASDKAVQGLAGLVSLIDDGILPRGVTYSVAEAKVNSGDSAMIISGPWAWDNLRQSGIDFGIAPIPGVDGHVGRPFVGVLSAFLNRASKQTLLSIEFLEHYVLTIDGLKTINADVPLGVPALNAYYRELSNDEHIRETMKSVELGQLMPNIPQFQRFWQAMTPAIGNAANGLSTPRRALQNAKKRMTPRR